MSVAEQVGGGFSNVDGATTCCSTSTTNGRGSYGDGGDDDDDEEEDDSSGGCAGTGGAIVVVAKCPIPNKSKTRLLPLLGVRGATQLAKAMLCDVLLTLSKCVSLFHLREDDCLRSS